MIEIPPSKWGRNHAMTPEVLERLKQAFSIGCTNKEAASYAEIAESTLQLHIKQTEGFREQIEQWKCKPILKARHIVVQAINNGDVRLAWEYMQKHLVSEFGTTRVENTGKNGAPIATTTVTHKQAKEMADELDKDFE